MTDNFVQYTNDYADVITNTPKIEARINKFKKSMFSKWIPTNCDEMWLYLTITLIMSIVQKPESGMYWINNTLFETPIFHCLMSREHFHSLRSMIHFYDVIQYDPDDPLKKLRYFLDKLLEKFKNNYAPEENIAIHEYLSLWKGCLSMRVYIPSKQERYGIKIFMLCESKTGCLSNFIIYTGSSTDYGDCQNIALDNYYPSQGMIQKKYECIGFWKSQNDYS